MELKPSLFRTAELLVNGIPRGAPHPTSPSEVNGLAKTLGIKDGSLTYRINRLIEFGLVENRCLANGRRHCLRDRNGRIIEIYGISFEPMMRRAAELAERADAVRAAHTEHTRLRHDISRLRRGMGHLVAAFGDAGIVTTWASLPARLTKLTIAELQRVIAVVKNLKADLTRRKNGGDRSEIFEDRPSNFDAQYTTEQDLSDSCNPTIPAENKKDCGQNSAQQDQPKSGLEHVTLDMILKIAPEDWHVAMGMHGRPSLHNLVGTAYQRAQALDVSPSAWAQAQSALGPVGAAVLVLLADAQSQDRGGRVRCPGGWVRRMSERAENGTAYLHRTVFGLLPQEKVNF